jgi:hypothetical protein
MSLAGQMVDRDGLPSFTTVRTITLFVGGLAGIAWETLGEKSERPTLLVVFAAMIGLPAFLRQDERIKKAIETLDPPEVLQPAAPPPRVSKHAAPPKDGE